MTFIVRNIPFFSLIIPFIDKDECPFCTCLTVNLPDFDKNLVISEVWGSKVSILIQSKEIL